MFLNIQVFLDMRLGKLIQSYTGCPAR